MTQHSLMTNPSRVDQGDIAPRTVSFEAADGWRLEGDLFEGTDPKAAILISAGTGFPRQFYKNLARYLADKGAVVLAFDYRGIGGSVDGDAATSGIDYPDWALDQSAAIDTLSDLSRGMPLTHVAHSVGGHFLGLIPSHAKIAKHAFVSVGTGYVGGHHLSNIPMELYFWWGMGAYSLLRYGSIQPVGGWKGEALPPKLFRTWRRWSHKRDYFKSELSGPLSSNHFDQVTTPIRSWLFADDPIATPRTSASLLSCYPNAPTETVFRDPSDYGLKRIGHEGAFRPGREKLWDEIWEWLAVN